MSALIHRYASNQNFQLGTAAVAGAALTATVLLSFQALRRQERVDALKRSIPSIEEEDRKGGIHTDVRALIISLALAEFPAEANWHK